jgi:hypothetical protein
VTGPATEGSDGERLAVTSECHECSEALAAAREAVTVARRLAMVADNAIVNGDFQRARAALRDLHEAVAATDYTAGHDAPIATSQRTSAGGRTGFPGLSSEPTAR